VDCWCKSDEPLERRALYISLKQLQKTPEQHFEEIANVLIIANSKESQYMLYLEGLVSNGMRNSPLMWAIQLMPIFWAHFNRWSESSTRYLRITLRLRKPKAISFRFYKVTPKAHFDSCSLMTNDLSVANVDGKRMLQLWRFWNSMTTINGLCERAGKTAPWILWLRWSKTYLILRSMLREQQVLTECPSL